MTWCLNESIFSYPFHHPLRQCHQDGAGHDAASAPSASPLPQALQPLGTASPSRILAALGHDHPMAGRELIARACVDLIRTGRFHHPSVVASLYALPTMMHLCHPTAKHS